MGQLKSTAWACERCGAVAKLLPQTGALETARTMPKDEVASRSHGGAPRPATVQRHAGSKRGEPSFALKLLGDSIEEAKLAGISGERLDELLQHKQQLEEDLHQTLLASAAETRGDQSGSEMLRRLLGEDDTGSEASRCWKPRSDDANVRGRVWNSGILITDDESQSALSEGSSRSAPVLR